MTYATHPHHLGSTGLGHQLIEWWRSVMETVRLWQERAVARDHLARLDDRMLQDIGLSRADVMRETDKPFWRA